MITQTLWTSLKSSKCILKSCIRALLSSAKSRSTECSQITNMSRSKNANRSKRSFCWGINRKRLVVDQTRRGVLTTICLSHDLLGARVLSKSIVRVANMLASVHLPKCVRAYLWKINVKLDKSKTTISLYLLTSYRLKNRAMLKMLISQIKFWWAQMKLHTSLQASTHASRAKRLKGKDTTEVVPWRKSWENSNFKKGSQSSLTRSLSRKSNLRNKSKIALLWIHWFQSRKFQKIRLTVRVIRIFMKILHLSNKIRCR